METQPRQHFDALILGQGLVGTTLAWQLLWRGVNVGVVDRGDASSASRVAAGLVSPIAGRRDKVSWRFGQLWAVAEKFYRRWESETGHPAFDVCGLVRLLADGEHGGPESTNQSFDQLDYHALTLAAPWPEGRHAVRFPAAGRLDTGCYLDVSRQLWREQQRFMQADVRLPDDVRLVTDGVQLPRLGLSADRLILCQGSAAVGCDFFDSLHLEPALGEILTVTIPDLPRDDALCGPIVRDDAWLVSDGAGRFRVGATFDRDVSMDVCLGLKPPQKTATARAELLQKLARFAPRAQQVVDHQVGVRPIVRGRMPRVGLHPEHSQLGVFNGLGSKGSLRAPWVALQFAQFLTDGNPLPRSIAYRSAKKTDVSPRRLIQVAQQRVAEVLRRGELAVDATAGNGLDTVFLAEQVGESGQVCAFDLQQVAIERTQQRLDRADLGWVRLVHASHAEMARRLPAGWMGQVGAVMFNLGYLPRADHSVTTEPAATLPAIEDGLRALRSGGVMTIVCYVGHAGGRREFEAVMEFLRQLPAAEFEVRWPREDSPDDSPRLIVIYKLASPSA